jgi:hypothetical protein
MKRKMRQDKRQIDCWTSPAWDGNVNSLIQQHVVPDGYKLSEVKKMGRKYTFVYVKEIPR